MENNKKKIYGLVRDHKDMQEQENINSFIGDKKILEFITKNELNHISNKNNCFVASSITDIGNNQKEVMKVITSVLENHSSIIFIKGNLKFFPEDKPGEIFTKIGRLNRMFRSNNSRQGLETRKKLGFSIGRKPGKAKSLKLDNYKETILDSLIGGESKTALCKKIDTSRTTLNDWLKARGFFELKKDFKMDNKTNIIDFPSTKNNEFNSLTDNQILAIAI